MTRATFEASIRATVRGMWYGQLDLFDFIDGMYSAIARGYEQAWREGAAECGIKPEERTPEETTELNEMIIYNQSFVVKFGDWLSNNDQESGAKLGNAFNRAALWINRYDEVKSQAQLMACKDQKLRWQWNPAIEQHCSTCRALNGRVHRASVWRRIDIYPQDTRQGKLECRGFNCGCVFVPTSDPATRGRIPKVITGKEHGELINAV